jgi:hypothetical protein
MHVLTASLYAVLIWISMVAFAALQGGVLPALVAAPVTVSTLVIGLISMDELVTRVRRRDRPST